MYPSDNNIIFWLTAVIMRPTENSIETVFNHSYINSGYNTLFVHNSSFNCWIFSEYNDILNLTESTIEYNSSEQYLLLKKYRILWYVMIWCKCV